MKTHTQITISNFYLFLFSTLLLEFTNIAFGTVDMIMVSPFGLEVIGAVGYSEVLTMVTLSLFTGVTRIFQGEFAKLEASHEGNEKVASLFISTAFATLVAIVMFAGVVQLIPSVLALLKQPGSFISSSQEYLNIKVFQTPIIFIYSLIAICLRIKGIEKAVIGNLVFGLILNTLLNYYVLYVGKLSTDPIWSVAMTSLVSYGIMLLNLSFYCYFKFRKKTKSFNFILNKKEVKNYNALYLRNSFSIGLRNMNDFMMSLAVMLAMGVMGAKVLSVYTIVSKIMQVYYRFPQAVCTTSFTFYNYSIGRKGRVKNLLKEGQRFVNWAIVPLTAITVALYFARSAILGYFVQEKDLIDLGSQFLELYLFASLFYLFEHLYSNYLNALHRTKVQFLISTGISYLFTVPLILLSVLYFESPESIVRAQCLGVSFIGFMYLWVYIKHVEKFPEGNSAEPVKATP